MTDGAFSSRPTVGEDEATRRIARALRAPRDEKVKVPAPVGAFAIAVLQSWNWIAA
jgi:hypothetical protein